MLVAQWCAHEATQDTKQSTPHLQRNVPDKHFCPANSAPFLLHQILLGVQYLLLLACLSHDCSPTPHIEHAQYAYTYQPTAPYVSS